jgi:fibronectin type 3 domain-containing protein
MTGMNFVRIWLVPAIIWLFVPLMVLAQATPQFNVRFKFGEDFEAPTIPTDVTATPISPFQIDVSWSASFDAFGVAGYIVFRDGEQIAITQATLFSDTGLTASTTYTYQVKAFDEDNNISDFSIESATTTFELPPPPPPPGEVTRMSSSGSFITPILQYLTLEVGSEAARIDFGVNIAVSYRIQYGRTDAMSDGVVQTLILREDHSTVLTDLQSNTTYFYEIYVTDRYGIESLLRSDTFTTRPKFEIRMPPNVTAFSALGVGTDVLLTWAFDPNNPPAYVRIVRSSRFFPADPFDGSIVYQGVGTQYTDTGALASNEIQYYTIFAYDFEGVPSSGQVASAVRALSGDGTDPTDPSQSEDDTVEPTSPSSPQFVLPLANIELIQDDQLQNFSDAVVVVQGESFVVRVPAGLVPTEARVVMVTFWKTDANWTASYLLQPDSDGQYYKAVLSGLERLGTHDVAIEYFNGKQERFLFVRGILDVIAPAGAEADDDSQTMLVAGIIWLFFGGFFGALSAFGLYRLFVWLFGAIWRRTEEEEEVRSGS